MILTTHKKGKFMINKSNLRFGVPAAERDNDLINCFIKNDSYNNVYNGIKTVILGNRGTGKSAIFKKLASEKRANGEIVIELTPENYSYEMLQQTLKRESDGAWAKKGAFCSAWKYLIYVLAMKKLCENKGSLKKGDEQELYSYLRANHANIEKHPIDALISYIQRIEGIKVCDYEASVKSKELHSLYKLEEIERLLKPLERITKTKNITFLVDELDSGWDNSEDAKAFISGLFQAAMSINGKHQHIKVLISLRKELYENIPDLYEDVQKYRDIIQYVEWDEEKLQRLICKRIIGSVEGLSESDELVAWNSVFVEELSYRKTKSVNYLLDRTLYRPREIIQFCNDIKEKNMDTTTFPWDYNSILNAEFDYSKSRAEDICSEYKYQYPGLISVLETFRGRQSNIERQELEFHCLQLSLGEINVNSEAKKWVIETDYNALIKILWEVCFLKAYMVGGVKGNARSGSQYLGAYQIGAVSTETIGRFQFHQLFRSFLNIKENR